MKKAIIVLGLTGLLLLALHSAIVAGTEGTRAEKRSVDDTRIAAVSGGVERSSAWRSDNYRIDWQVVSSGGGESRSISYLINTTVGQPVVGSGSSDSYGVTHGFVRALGGCCFLRGDVDHSGVLPIDIADLVWLVDYMFVQGDEPPCWDEGDIDGSGIAPIDIADLVYLVDYMFVQGAAPPDCPYEKSQFPPESGYSLTVLIQGLHFFQGLETLLLGGTIYCSPTVILTRTVFLHIPNTFLTTELFLGKTAKSNNGVGCGEDEDTGG
ncbi:MAG: hypothetical protein KAW61_10650 [candidate division Zixibacteria bacterium]|nr:hypothetical protein [candidate division Zixibacteria bacterium]